MNSRRVFAKLERLPRPVICAIDGFALGGGFEIALCSDILLVTPAAQLGLPEELLGLCPGGGGTRRLVRALGKYAGSDLMLAGWPAYAAAKGAVNALTVQTALDLAPAGIRVNAVAPGTILTPMNEKIFADLPDGGAALKAQWNAAHPLGRFGHPPEAAEAVAFLASDRASFITGEIIRVDGGLAIRGE